MRPDDPRQVEVRRDLEELVSVAQSANAQRAMVGEPPLEVALCLGEGRCLLVGGQKSPVVCPFCARVEVGPGTHREVETLARRIIGGN